jgi:hypothetical protein
LSLVAKSQAYRVLFQTDDVDDGNTSTVSNEVDRCEDVNVTLNSNQFEFVDLDLTAEDLEIDLLFQEDLEENVTEEVQSQRGKYLLLPEI